MILVTCVTIPLETATSPLLVPTTTLNRKSPPPLCRGHGEYPLRGKPRKLTPPSPPQPQPPLHHPPTQHQPAASLTTQTLSLPLPSLRDVGICGPLPRRLQHCGPQQRHWDGCIDKGVGISRFDRVQAYRQQDGCVGGGWRAGVSTTGLSTVGRCIDGGKAYRLSLAGWAYQ